MAINHQSCLGAMKPRLALSASRRVACLPSLPRAHRRRAAVAVRAGLAPWDNSSSPANAGEKQQGSSNPGVIFISYVKLLTLTGAMAAAMLLDKRPAHAAGAPRPEPVHTMSQAADRGTRPGKKGLWGKLKATATAPVGALDRLLFPDEPIQFIGSRAAPSSSSAESQEASSPAGPAAATPAAAEALSAYALSSTLTDDALTGPTASDTEAQSSSPGAAPGATLLPSSSQLAAAVSAATDSLAARLAQLSEAIAPGWPAETAALGAVSRLPAELSGAAAAPHAAAGQAASNDGCVLDGQEQGPAEVSAELARQLVRGGYALAGLVVAVMAWQLAACVADSSKTRPQAQRAPKDDAFETPQGRPVSSASSTPALTAAGAAAQAEPSAAPSSQQDSLPPQLQGLNVVGPFCLQPQRPQPQQQLPVVELGPDDDLPHQLQGRNVVGPLCLMRPSLGPASHGHFSAAAVAAAAATVDALEAEAEGMRKAAAAAVAAAADKPLQLATAQEVSEQGDHVMQAALAAAADAEAAAAAAPEQELQQQDSAEKPAVALLLTATADLTPADAAGGDEDDAPLFRVDLRVTEEGSPAAAAAPAVGDTAAAAAAAVGDSLEGRLAAEVVREALVAESCAAAAAAAAERAQIATHLIEDAIAAHGGMQAAAAAPQGGAAAAEPGEVPVADSWEEGEVTCSMAAEVRAAEMAAALASPDATATAAAADTAAQKIPISWQQQSASGSSSSSSTGQTIPVSWRKPAAIKPAPAVVSAETAIPVVWETLATSAAGPAAPAPTEQDVPVTWQQPAAAAVDSASMQQLVDEAKAAEAAAAEADAARAVAAAAVARVAAAKAAAVAAPWAPAVADTTEAQVVDVEGLAAEACAAEAAAAEAEAARAAAAAAVARVAAAKAAAAPADDTPEQSEPSLAADAAQQLIQEAKAAEAAAAEAETARATAAAAVARVAASRSALVRSAIEAVAAAVGSDNSLDAGSPADQPAATDSAAGSISAGPGAASGAEAATAAARAAQAELIAEAIAAEAAAFAAEAAAGAAGSATAAEDAAGEAAELVKGWYSSSTQGPAAAAPPPSSSSSTSSSSSSSVSGPPVSVSWVLSGPDESEALAQLTQLAAGLGHPAIGPVGGGSEAADADAAEGADPDSDLVEVMRWFAKQRGPAADAAGDTASADTDADAFKDEFAVPNDETPMPAQPSAGAAGAAELQPAAPTLQLAEVLDVASRQQMQAASQTALQQAQARVVALYLARRAACNSTPAQGLRVQEAQATKPPEAAATAAAAASPARPSAVGPGSQLACQLGVSDVALAMALSAFEGAEPCSPKSSPRSSSRGAGVTVLSSSGDPYASAAAAIGSSSSGKDAEGQAASPATAAEGTAGGFEVTVEQEGATDASTASGTSSNAYSSGRAKPAATRLQHLVDALYSEELSKRRKAAAAVAASIAAPAGKADTTGGSSKAAPAETKQPAPSAASVAAAVAGSASSRLSGPGSSRNNIVAAPGGPRRIEVVFESLDEEADSFEVAVQRMVLNTARINSSGGRRNAAPAAAAAAAAPPASSAAAAAKGGPTTVVEVPIQQGSKGPVGWGVEVQRAAAEPVVISVAGFDKPRSSRKAPSADSGSSTSSGGAQAATKTDSFDVAVQRMVADTANPAAAAQKRSTATTAPTANSGRSKGTTAIPATATAATTPAASSSRSKGTTATAGEVSIQIRRPDRKADSFDVAVQRMVADTAARRRDNDSSSSRSGSPSPAGPGKGFGRVVRTHPVRAQQQRSRPSSPGVPLFRASPGPTAALRQLPWWEQRAAARSTASTWGEWEGMKAAPVATAPAAAAEGVQRSAAPDAAAAGRPSPAASAAQAPTSIPVEWLETPTEQKRSQLRERASTILKQQQEKEAASSGSAPGAASLGATAQAPKLPAGWGMGSNWAAVSSELTRELESELQAEVLSSSAAAATSGSKDLTAPFATPKIAPTKTQQLLLQQKQRAGQQKQGQQGQPKRSRPQLGRAAHRGQGGSGKGSQA